MVTSLSFACILIAGTAAHTPHVSKQTAQEPPEVRAAVRKEITAGYDLWGKARLAFDKPTYDKMLTPDFYAQLPQRKLTRNEFIDAIATKNPQVKFLRFDSQILSLTKEGDTWIAVITEKMEIEIKGKDGQPDSKRYSLWITRDGWKKPDGHWMVAFTEAIGTETWREKPPIPGW